MRLQEKCNDIRLCWRWFGHYGTPVHWTAQHMKRQDGIWFCHYANGVAADYTCTTVSFLSPQPAIKPNDTFWDFTFFVFFQCLRQLRFHRDPGSIVAALHITYARYLLTVGKQRDVGCKWRSASEKEKQKANADFAVAAHAQRVIFGGTLMRARTRTSFCSTRIQYMVTTALHMWRAAVSRIRKSCYLQMHRSVAATTAIQRAFRILLYFSNFPAFAFSFFIDFFLIRTFVF